jgi:HD-GYP domain-containing protein (c-di-GMP phosphodiesterase class II)
MLANQAHAADRLGADLGLPAGVRAAVLQTFERWDGKGAPAGARGEAIPITARIVNLADVLAVFHRLGGTDAAVEVARERRRTQFDPDRVDLVVKDTAPLFAALEEAATWDAIIDAEPALGAPLTAERLDQALEAIGDFTDLKSPYTLGHTRSVTALTVTAAESMGWPTAEVTHLRRAGWLHDVGRLGVSNAIWDKPGPLSATEAERVRLHPYLTERMLASSPALAGWASPPPSITNASMAPVTPETWGATR